MTFLGRNVPAARAAVSGLADGVALHGISDGSWSLSDALVAVSEITGPSDVVVATWTAGDADLRKSADMLRSGLFRSFRLLVDRSFPTRQPRYCETMRELFGEATIRIWSSHAKFALFTGGKFDVLWLGSHNLNQNKRLESFSLFGGGTLPGEYGALVREMWEIQGDGEGLDQPVVGRQHTASILADSRQLPIDLADADAANLLRMQAISESR